MGGKKQKKAAAAPESDSRSGSGSGGKGKKPKPINKNDRHQTWTAFAEQLYAIGLRLRKIEADGNCLFRSVADQIEGDPSKHMEYRNATVEYMRENPADFQPFIDTDFKDVRAAACASPCCGVPFPARVFVSRFLW